MIFQCSSRRLRCENQADHDANTSSKRSFPGNQSAICSCFFRSRDASRTGSSKPSRLGSHFGSILDPQIVPTCPQRLQKSGRSGLPISKISLIWFFRLVCLVGLVVWVRPGGCEQTSCRVTASHALVRGGPRRNDPPCPSRGDNAVPLVSVFLMSLLRLVCFVCLCLG